MSAETVDSFRLLDHSQEVRSTILELNVELLELLAAARGRERTPEDLERLRDYQQSNRQWPPLLDRLRELTLDNPRQQERIGFLRARIGQTVADIDEKLAAGEPLPARVRIIIADITEGLLADEEALAQERQAQVERRIRLADRLTAATAIAQALLLCIVVWLAERQTARRAAAERERLHAIERARLIVDSVRDPIALVDENLALVQANPAFREFYGVEAVHGAALHELVGWQDSVLLQRVHDVLALRRDLWDFETEQEVTNGSPRQVIVNARTVELPESTSTTALLTVSDITVAKLAEDQILELNRQLSGKIDQLTEVNRELEAFSYSVSHDLRAPLRHIAGFADKLVARLGDAADPKLVHYCGVIADSARRMSSLIEDLLAYSRLGRHALRLQPVDMQSLVEEVRSTLVSGVEDRDFEWTIAPLPVVIADGSMLRLAWQNLLDNAIKYTAGREPARITIGVRDNGEEREFWIGDNGVGFDMQYASKLFGVFQRLHKASEFQGTGIGLASVRRVIARHGGRTWAESEPGKGTTVHFTLPRHDITS
ncbi:MAG: PAS domain-containing protein [Xanthomonadales bacterium]|nr:PAS domain-containing protein [Xanthomonadales bacterium]